MVALFRQCCTYCLTFLLTGICTKQSYGAINYLRTGYCHQIGILDVFRLRGYEEGGGGGLVVSGRCFQNAHLRDGRDKRPD